MFSLVVPGLPGDDQVRSRDDSGGQGKPRPPQRWSERLGRGLDDEFQVEPFCCRVLLFCDVVSFFLGGSGWRLVAGRGGGGAGMSGAGQSSRMIPVQPWVVLGRCGTPWHALGRSREAGTLWDVLGRSRPSWKVLGRSGTLGGAQGRSGTSSDARVGRTTPLRKRVFRDALKRIDAKIRRYESKVSPQE